MIASVLQFGSDPALRSDVQSSGSDVLLEVANLSKRRGRAGSEIKILASLTMAIRRGEFVSVVGPSGCGKTTLLLCLAGLLKPDSGRVSLGGSSVEEAPAGVSIVFQDYGRSLFPWKTNLENIVFGMRRNSQKSRKEKRERARDLLRDVGLEGFEWHYPWQISGGMQQRVAIARALAANADLLLLDEPMAAIDAQTRSEMQDLILDLRKRFKQTMLLVTHDIEESIYMADRVFVLSTRPASVVAEITVDLPQPRDQLQTREHSRFLALRHKVLELIRAQRR